MSGYDPVFSLMVLMIPSYVCLQGHLLLVDMLLIGFLNGLMVWW
jgi:hypothetical protein